ncbi:hypothetical protein [Kitasatospora sp. NPDC057015]|uniref:hypothetical protein n=1 Tax=Kitasatospora sp. NPDC057015 TaxID=3346001 RepID=UPI003643D36E
MPDALPIPDDLLELERARLVALEAVVDCVHELLAAHRRRHPGPSRTGPAPTDEPGLWSEADETRLDALRTAFGEASARVRRHPTMVRALAEHRYRETELALRAAVAGPDHG